MRQTIGDTFISVHCPADGKPWSRARAERISDAVTNAIAEAERRGFELAVEGGKEAAGKMMPGNSRPVVLYFGSDQDCDEFIAIVREAKPGLVAHKISKP